MGDEKDGKQAKASATSGAGEGKKAEGKAEEGKTEGKEESPEQEWLSGLVRELFQTEKSAKTHPIVEADRLGDVPPAQALRAVAAHAERAFADLPTLAQIHDLPDSDGGTAVGAAFSALRDSMGDLLLTAEKSYRGTVLGMRHGVDLVELVQHVAAHHGDKTLAVWCTRWLSERRPLVEACARELAWFAANPERAAEPAKDNPLAFMLHGLVHGVEVVAEKVRGVVR
ncbi:hypothetical protein [Chondromyces apiculatus]|uniref:Uncharacterized protein n=1 Tax=Chondromyces apiculatus DSM 436 TaxID=1192034 RepID=A0A017T958_9BACT|nr:hypothetical protein [Chondromyces apiculatus]EYF05121.1 Hypothetical protein CAP_3484 [Chondromyces apiculatus DSM 436]